MNNVPYYAVAGLKNSGKNTAAEMLTYCLNTPRFLHKYYFYKVFKHIKGKYKLISFAKPMKEMLAVLLNVPVSRFEDRVFKDNTYIYFPELKLEKNPLLEQKLSPNTFNRLLAVNDYTFLKSKYITIRQLMQCFATDIMRNIFGDKLWILSTLKRKYLVISDLRFKIEAEEIHKQNGKILYINRNSCTPDNHASEQEVLSLYENNTFDYVIDNNKSKKDLFDSISALI